jgi:hypothetical protein
VCSNVIVADVRTQWAMVWGMQMEEGLKLGREKRKVEE